MAQLLQFQQALNLNLNKTNVRIWSNQRNQWSWWATNNHIETRSHQTYQEFQLREHERTSSCRFSGSLRSSNHAANWGCCEAVLAVRVLPGSDATLEALATLIRGRLAEASRFAGLGSKKCCQSPGRFQFLWPRNKGF